jgi:hypothetical protein
MNFSSSPIHVIGVKVEEIDNTLRNEMIEDRLDERKLNRQIKLENHNEKMSKKEVVTDRTNNLEEDSNSKTLNSVKMSEKDGLSKLSSSTSTISRNNDGFKGTAKSISNSTGMNVAVNIDEKKITVRNSELQLSGNMTLKYKSSHRKIWKETRLKENMDLNMTRSMCCFKFENSTSVRAGLRPNVSGDSGLCLYFESMEDPVFISGEKTTVKLLLFDPGCYPYLIWSLIPPFFCLWWNCIDDGKRKYDFKIV